MSQPPYFWVFWFMVAIYPLVVVPNSFGFELALGERILSIHPNYFYAPRYFLLALTAAAALLLLLHRLKSNPQQRQQRHWELVPLLAFLFFGLIATSLASYPQTAWFGTPMRWTGFTTDLYCVVLFLLAWYTLSLRQIDLLLRWLVGTAAVVAVLAVLQYYGLNLVPHEPFRAKLISFGTMANPNFLGTYMVFTLPAAILIFLHRRRTWPWLLVTALIYAGLLVSLTRGVWLAGAFIFLVLVWYTLKGAGSVCAGALPGDLPDTSQTTGPSVEPENTGRRLNRWLGGLSGKKALLVLALVLVLVTAALAPARDGYLLSRVFTIPGEMTAATQLEPRAGADRMFIWRETLRLWLMRPDITLFGLGPDHLVYVWIVTPSGSFVDKAHNIFLERAVTQGTGTLLAYLALLAAVLYRLPGSGRGTGFLLTAMLTAYLVQGLFNIEVIMIMPLFWIVLGMAMACKDREKGVG
jgi:O-antigen ligase